MESKEPASLSELMDEELARKLQMEEESMCVMAPGQIFSTVCT